MEDLRIYDYDLNLLHIENDILSASWQIYFNDVGKAEIHLSKNNGALDLLYNNKYLIITQGKKQAIITGLQIGNDCVIYARTPNWILSRKVLAPIKKITVNVELFVREKISEIFSDCPDFELGNICNAEVNNEFYEEGCIGLLDFIKDSLKDAGLGHRVYFDIKNKKWVFEILKGENRKLVVSESNLNCYDSEYVFDLQNSFNSGFYETKNSYPDTYIMIWENVKTEKKSGLLDWETILYSRTQADAKKELGLLKTEESLSVKLKNIEYGKDYNLGDIITVQFEKGNLRKTADLKVVALSSWQESGDSGEMPIFEE